MKRWESAVGVVIAAGVALSVYTLTKKPAPHESVGTPPDTAEYSSFQLDGDFVVATDTIHNPFITIRYTPTVVSNGHTVTTSEIEIIVANVECLLVQRHRGEVRHRTRVGPRLPVRQVVGNVGGIAGDIAEDRRFPIGPRPTGAPS